MVRVLRVEVMCGNNSAGCLGEPVAQMNAICLIAGVASETLWLRYRSSGQAITQHQINFRLIRKFSRMQSIYPAVLAEWPGTDWLVRSLVGGILGYYLVDTRSG